MKKPLFFLFILSFSVYGNLISTPSGTLTVDDNEEILVNSIQVEDPMLLGFDVDNGETVIIDPIVVTNPTTGSMGPDFVGTVSPDLGNGNIDVLDGISVLPESNTITLLALGLLVMRMLPRRTPSG